MGTRSLTHVREVLPDGKPVVLVTIYRQFDGYPRGQGAEVANFLSGHRIVNGIGTGATPENAFNGPGDLAARLIATLVNDGPGIGNFYILSPGAHDCGEEYTYVVDVPWLRVADWSVTIRLRAFSGVIDLTGDDLPDPIFDGEPDTYADWLVAYELLDTD